MEVADAVLGKECINRAERQVPVTSLLLYARSRRHSTRSSPYSQ